MPREKNFTDAEVWALIHAVQPVHTQLVQGFTNNWTQDMRERLWLKITAAVNAVNPDVIRTKNKVQEQWGHLKSKALVKARDVKYDINKTGGGVAEGVLKPKHLAILQFLPQETIVGLKGCERLVANC